ncbi:MAG: UDP-N-acetylmuramate dehydrogenase [Christensenellales bacterium]|jgi:UDP-N-acetylmuramate dehydrogenase
MKKNNFILKIKKNCTAFYEDENMGKHTSFKTGGIAKYFCRPKSVQALASIVKTCNENNLKYYILGNGTNTVFFKFDGLVICLRDLRQICVLEDDLVVCEAGVDMFRLNLFLSECNLSGMAWSYGIPGSVGGAVIMNAGAYGGEIGNVVEKIEVFDGKRFKTLKKNKLWFSYRKSCFSENKLIVTKVYLRLKKEQNNEEIKETMFSIFEKRKKNHPLDYPSAGSVFKRQGNFIPGMEIEKRGLKGTRIGGAEVSQKHAGFIMNKEAATPQDVKALVEFVKAKMFEEKGVALEQEVIFVDE